MKRTRKSGATFLALFLFASFAAHLPFGSALVSVGYHSERTCFSVKYRGEESSYKVTPLFVLPSEDVQIQIATIDPDATFNVGAEWKAHGKSTWVWKAPRKTGLYPSKIVESKSGETMMLNMFVMIPYGKVKSDTINGYRIGRYPKIPATKKFSYELPRGYIEVTKANRDTMISPHFKLGQFLCKQEGQYPKYVVLRERLVLKLEYMLEAVNAEGIPARTFTVMSGYRTPYYNTALNNVRYSRHMWGDAADIYINNDSRNDVMDDLNGDGKRDAKDAEMLYDIVDELKDNPAFKPYIGGLGWYKPTKMHGPFVHVDARGTPAHWNSEN